MLEKTYLKTKESEQSCDKIIIKRSAQFFCVQSGKCLCRIKSRNFLSAENVILDEQGNEKYYTGFVPYKNSLEAEDERICERYAIFDNTSKIASAYTIKANINKKQSGLIIPRIFKLFVDFSGDMFMICRMEDNSFVIKNGENTIAVISPFTLIKPHTMEVFGGQDVCFLAALFSLIRYMVHEEDLAIV